MPEEARPIPPVRPRPVPQMADPKKFLAGENIEKLKGLLKDVDEFATKVKTKGKEVEATLDSLRDFTQKFGETVQFMNTVVLANKQLFERMISNMEQGFRQITEGKTNGGRDQRTAP